MYFPRPYLTPVRDEEAESQRKARSRQARQTRRSTQGVTLTELKEAQSTYSFSAQDTQEEGEGRRADGSGVWRSSTEHRSVNIGRESPARSRTDEQGNIEPRLEVHAESPTDIRSYSSVSGLWGLPRTDISTDNCCNVVEGWWRDENQNPVEDAAQISFAPKPQQGLRCYDLEGLDEANAKHERVSRVDSSGGDGAADKALGRTSSYMRREARLASLNRLDDDSGPKDYKKMYETALHENEKLKSRLQDSKQELARIRSQLERVTQRQDRMSERSSSVLESEKREKHTLEKRVSDMEEEVKVLTELKSDNQRLKDENGALIRVISKLSK